jgi:hypothetical protein
MAAKSADLGPYDRGRFDRQPGADTLHHTCPLPLSGSARAMVIACTTTTDAALLPRAGPVPKTFPVKVPKVHGVDSRLEV